tara:strand:- start:759 stop:1001 length:243 start_codon:yes stop_codon:yes gene_type:complete
MFGDLLKNLLKTQAQSALHDKLGSTGTSILSGLFGGGNFGDKFESPLQGIFGDKWQEGSDMFHRNRDGMPDFSDILKYLK